MKCLKRQEFVIGGYTNPGGSRKYFGSLLLGTYDQNRKLIYHGRVGTGFTESSLKFLYPLVKKNETQKNPFHNEVPGQDIHWIKPKLVAEVAFTSFTQDGILRHPSFKGLRRDKSAKNIVREHEVSMQKISALTKKISNPNKLLYPEAKISKLEVAEYYAYIAPWILPFLKNRPLTLLRCPESYKSCFYQKHIVASSPNSLHPISKYFYIKDKKGLLDLAQLGTLELHPWGSRNRNIEKPDMIIFDLDPAANVKWSQVVAAAKEIKKYFADFNLKSFVKSTGGKGLHVVIPITAHYEWNVIKTFTHDFVELLTQKNPKKYIAKMTKAKRAGKIFIDYLRNQRGATAIAAYSTRATAAATIAVPLHWDELTNNKKDVEYTLKNIYQRMENLKEDPWREFFEVKQRLPKL